MLSRVVSDDRYVDTDNNAADFVVAAALLPTATPLIDYVKPVPIVDVCANLEDVQATMPDGYDFDEAGTCQPTANDLCKNLALVQLQVPPGSGRNANGDCVPDVCANLPGVQEVVPIGYAVGADGNCMRLEDRAIQLTELLPNISGVDTGKEFIEFYNPFDETISLSGYTLFVGKNFEKSYTLSDVTIPPRSYITLSDTQLGFTLVNTSSGVRLVAPAGNVASETFYNTPKDDWSWALIDDTWQYTNVLTPGKANIATVESEEPGKGAGAVATLSPCPSGKYRNPLTNRCRNIETDVAVLASCGPDQYRNPETNRCRKISTAASSLTPCQAGYERNPATNRCRKATTATSELTPCKIGYERNPETNRCRKIIASTANPAATVAKTNAGSDNQSAKTLQFWTMGLLGAGVVSYGVYEWRREIAGAFKKVFRLGG